MATADLLQTVLETKIDIREALRDKGMDVDIPFTKYADFIKGVPITSKDVVTTSNLEETLQVIADTKESIKAALIDEGMANDIPFTGYADFIETLTLDGGTTPEITIGKFVAVGDSSNKAAYSTNGIDWTAATLPSGADWQSVTYGNGKFVAIAYRSNKAAYSTNGINWTAATMPSSATWMSVTYGDGKFVAIAWGTNKAAYSEDGITWEATTLPSSALWLSVAYG
jgi:hypothetical protein